LFVQRTEVKLQVCCLLQLYALAHKKLRVSLAATSQREWRWLVKTFILHTNIPIYWHILVKHQQD